MRRRWCLLLAVPMAVLLDACAPDQTPGWCEGEGARILRERSLSGSRFRRVEEMLRGVAEGEVVLFAHRGGFHCEELDAAPENSLANVEKAVRMGFDGFESDLWRTSDGEFVVHHDATLDRTTHEPGRVSLHTLEQIRTLSLMYPSGSVSQEKVPTLQEFLRACRDRIIPLIEPKGLTREYLPEILQIAREAGVLDQVLVWVTWSEETVLRYEEHLQAGLAEVRTNVVWRVDSLEKLEDVVSRFDPPLIDLSPSMRRLELEKSFLHIAPRGHMSLIERVVPTSSTLMVSRIITNSYLDAMYERGVRVFMSRDPERQLLHLVEKGLHP